MNILRNLFCRYVCFLLLVTLAPVQPAKGSNVRDDGIGYEIIAKSTVSKGDAYITLKLMIVNHSSEPVFISRGIGRCSKWSGHSQIQLLNERNENVLHSGCDVAELPIADADLKDTLHNSDLWIRLLPDEIYGEEEAIAIPNRRGSYRIRAELRPPGFPEQQKRLLKEQGIRVLEHSHRSEEHTSELQ